LQLQSERRSEERLPYLESIEVHPVLSSGELGQPLVGQAKDISNRGMGLYLPCRPPTSCIFLQICAPHYPPVRVPAQIVRTVPCADGRFEVGTRFAWEDI
jgi:hypothetical protein